MASPTRYAPIELLGAMPPAGFEDDSDGLTGVPDLWMTPAGVRHDYAYALIRRMKSNLRRLRTARKRLPRRSYERDLVNDTIRELRIRIRNDKHRADLEFRENIRRLSKGSLSKRITGRVVGRVYWRGVRCLGWLGLRRKK